MGRKCCVPLCQTSATMPSHGLPCSESVRKAWLTNIERLDLLDLPLREVTKYRICYRHFEEDMVQSFGAYRKLKENAIPTLHLPEVISSSIQLEDNVPEVASAVEVSDGEIHSQVETSEVLLEPASPYASPSPSMKQSPPLSPPQSPSQSPTYSASPDVGRSNGKRGTDDLLSQASESMKKYCDNESRTLSDFDIAGMKYARDLASLEVMQRIYLEKIMSDALFYAKQGKLSEHSSFQLGMSEVITSNPGPSRTYTIPVHRIQDIPNMHQNENDRRIKIIGFQQYQ